MIHIVTTIAVVIIKSNIEMLLIEAVPFRFSRRVAPSPCGSPGLADECQTPLLLARDRGGPLAADPMVLVPKPQSQFCNRSMLAQLRDRSQYHRGRLSGIMWNDPY
jgi:hypothetical protein